MVAKSSSCFKAWQAQSHKVTALGFIQELSWTASKPGMKLGGHVPSELKREGYLGHARQVLALELCKSIQISFPKVFTKIVPTKRNFTTRVLLLIHKSVSASLPGFNMLFQETPNMQLFHKFLEVICTFAVGVILPIYSYSDM